MPTIDTHITKPWFQVTHMKMSLFLYFSYDLVRPST